MQTILIDTQVLVWLINEDRRLGHKALAQVSNPANRVLVSYFSLFEITIKASIGKMIYDDALIDVFSDMGVELVTPSRKHLQNYRIFNLNNKDPFDNILLAVAIAEQCDFMTADDAILATDVEDLKITNAKQ